MNSENDSCSATVFQDVCLALKIIIATSSIAILIIVVLDKLFV